MSKLVLLPLTTVQHDFRTVIADVKDSLVSEDSFWVSCYKTNESSIHAKVRVRRSDAGDLLYEPDNGIQLMKSSSGFVVAPNRLCTKETPVRSPRQTISVAEDLPAKISAFDISPDGKLIATGHDNGVVAVQHRTTTETDKTKMKHKKLHLDAVNALRFFPSSQVLLSAGADFAVSVISPFDLTVPRTFKGHRRAVTDTAIVGRGKNVLSCAKDGTVRLWDCASGSQIQMMGVQSYSPIMQMNLGQETQDWQGKSSTRTPSSQRPEEVETSGKLIFCALQNGHLEVLDLSSKSSAYTTVVPSQGALTAIAYSPNHNMAVCGSVNGVLTAYDVRRFDTPLFSCQRNTASIEDVAFVWSEGSADPHIAVATYDGTPFVLSARAEDPGVVTELIGYNCDPCRVIRCTTEGIWTAGDDGAIRKF